MNNRGYSARVTQIIASVNCFDIPTQQLSDVYLALSNGGDRLIQGEYTDESGGCCLAVLAASTVTRMPVSSYHEIRNDFAGGTALARINNALARAFGVNDVVDPIAYEISINDAICAALGIGQDALSELMANWDAATLEERGLVLSYFDEALVLLDESVELCDAIEEERTYCERPVDDQLAESSALLAGTRFDFLSRATSQANAQPVA